MLVRSRRALVMLLFLVCSISMAPANAPSTPIAMTGVWNDDTGFSAAVILASKHLVIGSDEEGFLQVGKPSGQNRFERVGAIPLASRPGESLANIEATGVLNAAFLNSVAALGLTK